MKSYFLKIGQILLLGIYLTSFSYAKDNFPLENNPPIPHFEWDFKDGLKDKINHCKIILVDSNNQKLSSSALITTNLPLGDKAIVLNGKSYLLTRYWHNNSFTLSLTVRFTSSPKGILFSRNRPSDGKRGFECGLSSSNFYTLDGKRPTAMISAGGKKSICPLIFPQKYSLRKHRWYKVFFRFKAGQAIYLDVFDIENAKHIFGSSTSCKNIKNIASSAGENFLAIGGRRNNSRSGRFIVPKGTAIGNILIWNEFLNDKTIWQLADVKIPDRVLPKDRKPTIIHVKGNNSSLVQDGITKQTALSSIQKALDIVIPGDTVIVHEGVYFEIPVIHKAGTPDKPITLCAASISHNSVILTAANRQIREKQIKWTLESLSHGLYSAPFDHLPARVLYSGTDLLPYPSLDGLKIFSLLNGYPGARHGFFYDPSNSRLYVRLHSKKLYGSTNPNHHIMAVAPQNAPGHNGSIIYLPEHGNLMIDVEGDAHIIIKGFTFETPGASAVITRGSNVTVSDCWFNGCRYGVCGVKNTSNVIIEHCDYHHYPAFNDMKEIIGLYRNTPTAKKYPIFWWHRKGVHHNRKIMKNYETGIAGGIGTDWKVVSNNIHDAFEGLTWGASEYKGMEVVDNTFQRLVDNAIETENYAKDMRIHNNDFIDVFEPISWQPLGGLPWPGPIFVYRNRFFTTPECRNLWPWTATGCFKLGVSGSNWQRGKLMGKTPYKEPRSRISKRFVVVPYPGFLVFNNTIIFPHGYLLSMPQPPDRELVNFRFFNNVIIVKGMCKRPPGRFMGSLIEFYNNAIIATEDAKRAIIIAGDGGIVLNTVDELGLSNPEQGEISLSASSLLCHKGTLLFREPDALIDLGAVAAGKQWPSSNARGPRSSKQIGFP